MKKIVMSLAAITATVALSAAEAPKAKKDTAMFAGGTVSGQIKAMHILSDKTNGWAPETGSGYLGTLKYVTPNLFTDGLKAGAAFYVNGDTGFTDWDNLATKKPAQGMFTGSSRPANGGGDAATLLGQAYVEYKSAMFDATVGRQILNTPLTKIKWSLMPNFYQAAIATVKPVKGLSLTALHIDAMSYGSRSATDFMLIGEGTGTAGVTKGLPGKTIQQGGTREQAKFINLGHAIGQKDTNGMTAVNATYKMGKNLKVSIWDYIADDISNTIYADVNYKMPVMKGTKLSLSAQYLTQSEEGAKLAGTIDFSMYGAKAKIGNKKWSAYLAYNSSDNSNSATFSGFHNAFGADPAYTSSLFSRNAYREDVSAYKIGGHYTIMKGLKVMASHADYGKSKTNAGGGGYGGLATNDATETDIVIAYKPTKAWMLKIFNAIRKSEYSDARPLGREMNHFRVVAAYTF